LVGLGWTDLVAESSQGISYSLQSLLFVLPSFHPGFGVRKVAHSGMNTAGITGPKVMHPKITLFFGLWATRGIFAELGELIRECLQST
jgi:hypothetical protein